MSFPWLKHNRRSQQNLSSPKIDFSAVIEQLKIEKLTMATELDGLQDQVTKATELKQLAEEEAARSHLMIQAAEVDKQIL